MLICSVLFIGLLGGFANARHIVCRKDAAACSATVVDGVPWSPAGATPAPKPECMDGYAVYDATDEYDYGQPNWFSIKWMQKWVDIDDINGYFITATSSSSSLGDNYNLTLNREKLQPYRDGEMSFATFNFTVEGFRNGIIILHAMPMYAIDSKEYSLTLKIDNNEVVPNDICPPNINTVPSTTMAEDGEKMTKNGIEVRTSKQNLKSATTKTVQMVPLTITVLACILTSVGTVVLLLVFACLWMIICKVLEKPQRTKAIAQLKHGQNARKRGFNGKPAVFLMTSMAEGENDDHNAEFYKIVALCLVDTLRNSGNYEVSCNLWMMKEISDCGVAVWAHNMIKSHKIFIALCNKSTVASMQQWLTTDSEDKHLVRNNDPSGHVICRLMRNISHQNKKLIIVCIEEGHHDCLAYLPLPGLENCSHFNLTYEFPEFINALNPKGQYLRGNKTTTMRKSFSEILIKNRARYQQSCFSNENAMRNDIFSQKYEKLPAEIPEPKHFCHIDETRLDESFQSFSKGKQQSRSSSSLEKVVTETQYDSVFSSRCNSHSTESLSSCDDTGFHENLDRKVSHKMAHYQATGARPKAQKM